MCYKLNRQWGDSMKAICDFCKTEYNLTKMPNTPVKCAICGHVWVPHKHFSSKSVWLKFFVVLSALVAACVFSFVAIVKFQNNAIKKKPLIASINEKTIHLIKDENGENRIFVSGNITNNTDEIYGLPAIIIVSYDVANNVLSRQAFTPPATLLEPKMTVTFNHILDVNPTNVKRVSVELKESK